MRFTQQLHLTLQVCGSHLFVAGCVAVRNRSNTEWAWAFFGGVLAADRALKWPPRMTKYMLSFFEFTVLHRNCIDL